MCGYRTRSRTIREEHCNSDSRKSCKGSQSTTAVVKPWQGLDLVDETDSRFDFRFDLSLRDNTGW